MKKTTFISSILILGFLLFPLSSLNAQVVELQWNTFLGSTSNDAGWDIVLDSSGNIYITGDSTATWGSPVNAHSGGYDAFVAKLSSSGNLLWNTFLGSSVQDNGYAIALGSSGNVYVAGLSFATWGSPLNAFSSVTDAFVAKLDGSGNLLWNTFLGSAGNDAGWDIVLDSSGNVYLTGYSATTWGFPKNAHSGGDDVFVVCLDSSGNPIWNTFLGSASTDRGYGIALDSSGNVYVTGNSNGTWGSPVNVHVGSSDVFAACLDSSGNLLWNTFLGSSGDDYGRGIALDSSGNVYIAGRSDATWGSPINAHSGGYDAFAISMDSSGNLIWHTFLGSVENDYGHAIALDSSGNVYVTGYSYATWGSPVNAYNGNADAFVAYLDGSGNQLWNTFLGSASIDHGYGIALDSWGNVYVTGNSFATWGSPVNTHNGGSDIFVARLNTDPLPDITANGSDGPLSITQSDTLQIRVSLQRWGSSENVDYWLAYKGPSGWVHYNNTTKKWEAGLGVTHQGPLMDINNKKAFQKSGLAPGVYTFYFGVDMDMNGKVTKSSLYKDEVQVTVTQ